MSGIFPFRFVLIAVLGLTLAGCKSNEERAEEYYQSGLELIEAGDVDRAIVELRNVFEFDENHREARAAIAGVMYDRGNLGEAYRQYLRLIEQYPDALDARVVLAELSFQSANWDEFARHSAVISDTTGADRSPRLAAVLLGEAYRSAVIAEDMTAAAGVAEQVAALKPDAPENVILLNVLLDSYARERRYGRALIQIDELIAITPESRAMYDRRLAVLAQMEDAPAIEEQLRDMVDRFADDQQPKSMLLQYYISRQELDKAEAFLRSIADPAAEEPGLFLDLIRFVEKVHGPDAARAAIEEAIAVNPRPDRFRAMLAMMDFGAGQRDKAINDLEAILKAGEPSDEFRGIKVLLARLFVQMDNEVGARRLVEEVLAEDPAQVEALKMRASWQIQNDDISAAISNLRLALDGAPEDVQAMTLMAEAYTREGNQDLANEFLALAVQVTNNAPAPTVRYAQVLIREERFLAAEDILLPALRQSPGDLGILNLLGRLYLAMEDAGRTAQVIDALRDLNAERASRIADEMQMAQLAQNQGTDEAMAFLETLADGERGGMSAQIALVRARLRVGQVDEALLLSEELVADNPDNRAVRLVYAAALQATGQLAASRDVLTETLQEDPLHPRSWIMLSRLLGVMDGTDAALTTIEDGLAANPDDASLLWVKASLLERQGDIDAAIDIYQTMYDRSSGSVIVANNLASLLSSHKSDDESLERAWVIARRLRDTEVPALQDTYGWLLYLRGEPAEALPYLESAATALSNDPLVQAHLGLTYVAVEDVEKAIVQLQKAVELAGPLDKRDQIEQARTLLLELQKQPEE